MVQKLYYTKSMINMDMDPHNTATMSSFTTLQMYIQQYKHFILSQRKYIKFYKLLDICCFFFFYLGKRSFYYPLPKHKFVIVVRMVGLMYEVFLLGRRSSLYIFKWINFINKIFQSWCMTQLAFNIYVKTDIQDINIVTIDNRFSTK